MVQNDMENYVKPPRVHPVENHTEPYTQLIYGELPQHRPKIEIYKIQWRPPMEYVFYVCYLCYDVCYVYSMCVMTYAIMNVLALN